MKNERTVEMELTPKEQGHIREQRMAAAIREQLKIAAGASPAVVDAAIAASARELVRGKFDDKLPADRVRQAAENLSKTYPKIFPSTKKAGPDSLSDKEYLKSLGPLSGTRRGGEQRA